MKRVLAAVLLGLLLPMIQGALSAFAPTGWFPDFGLLLVVALGLAWPGAIAGALLAAWVGFVCDLLSGSLVGQHALLWLCTYAAARVVSAHVNLHGAPTQMVLCAALTAAAALAMSGLTSFFARDGAHSLAVWPELLRQIAVNSLCGPPLIAGVASLVARLDDESGRRVLRLEPRRLGP